MLATYAPLTTVTVTTDAMAVESRIVREVRRNSDSLRAQHLWDAIRAVRAQKQIPAIPRMARYMTRHHGLSKEATQRLLDLGVEDNLIKLETKIGTKGNKNGIEERAYRLPTHDMLPKERYDWYCFHCHNGGEVVLCIGCHRVYHETCLKEPLSEVNDFFCNFCKIMQKVPEVTTNKRERKDLNQLLLLCVTKLREKMPGNLMAREPPASARNSFELPERPPKKQKEYEEQMKKQQEDGGGEPMSPKVDEKKPEPEDDRWRAKFLLKEPMDFDMMEHKCQSNQYRIVEEFRADALLIVHNTVIYHGGHSNMADLARQMFRDCTYDLKEITQCRDCYRFATEKPNKLWYCKPCRPFHELVYARQKGFTFWPAKVIRVSNPERPDGGAYDVRFFGGYHQRAVVDKSSIRPITVSVSSLGVKRTSLWNKACDELKKHQEFVAKVKATMPGYESEPPYGDPFTSDEIKEFFTSLLEEEEVGEDDGDEATKEELEQIKRNLEEEDGSSKIMQTKPVAIKSSAPPETDVSPPKKKRPGRPPKNKQKQESNPRDKMTETTSVGTGLEENMVSSSSQEPRVASIAIQTPSKLLKDLIAGSSKISKDELRQLKEKIRAEVEADKDQEKKRAVNVATRSLERDLERLKADHATEVEQLNEKHKQEMGELKKKQWCYNCEAEAIYWCCWNTAYCTIECQQEHWHREHKRMCRRKR